MSHKPRKLKLSREEALYVSCPICDARPGDECIIAPQGSSRWHDPDEGMHRYRLLIPQTAEDAEL